MGIIDEQLKERTEALHDVMPPEDCDAFVPLRDGIVFLMQIMRSKLRTERLVLGAVMALILAVFFDIKLPIRGLLEKWAGGEIELVSVADGDEPGLLH